MRKVIFWGSLAAGFAAAYLMYRRGESLGTIAERATMNPVGSLVEELQS